MIKWIPAVLIVALLPTTWAWADDIETRAKWLENRLMAPCCMANTLAVHESGAAYRMRDEIRQMLGNGMQESEILDVFVERHGPQILALPPASGFNLTPYLVPMILLLASTVVLFVVMRRWRRDQKETETRARPAHKLSSSDEERIQQALREF